MRKEYFALGLMLLILLGNIWNQRRLETLTTGLESQIEEACSSVRSQDWADAASEAEAAEESWLGAKGYTQIFIRHTDIDALTAAFCAYRGAIAGQDEGETLGAYLLLQALLRSLREMERLSPGSIL